MFAFVGLLGFALFVITTKTHSFRYFRFIYMWTSELGIFLLFFSLYFQDVEKIVNGCEQGLTWLLMSKQFLLQVEGVHLYVFYELFGRKDLLLRLF